MKLKTNDKVEILAGKDRGKSGKIIQVFPKEKKVVVEGLNKIKKHIRSNKKGEKGQIIELSAPLQISNVIILCPKCSKKTRIGIKLDGNKKIRICKKCNESID